MQGVRAGRDRRTARKHKKWTSRDYTLFAVACCGLLFLLVFSYIPMAGILIAFKDDTQYFNLTHESQYETFESLWKAWGLI